jgi:hypothetical protein
MLLRAAANTASDFLMHSRSRFSVLSGRGPHNACQLIRLSTTRSGRCQAAFSGSSNNKQYPEDSLNDMRLHAVAVQQDQRKADASSRTVMERVAAAIAAPSGPAATGEIFAKHPGGQSHDVAVDEGSQPDDQIARSDVLAHKRAAVQQAFLKGRLGFSFSAGGLMFPYYGALSAPVKTAVLEGSHPACMHTD